MSEVDGGVLEEGVGENEWGQGVGGDVLYIIVFIYVVFYFYNLIKITGGPQPQDKKPN